MAEDTLYFRCPCGQLNRVPGTEREREPVCGRCARTLDGQPVPIRDADLQKLLQASPVPVLVDFYADWCGPCRQLSPVLAQLASEHRGRLIVVKINTDQDQDWAARLKVQGIPAVFLFKDGELRNQFAGYRPLAFWQGWLRDL